jgi:RimJ/RimL family protein N-acetyltransferase
LSRHIRQSDNYLLQDYLAASHHRQGIMTDAVDTMLQDWAIPRMNVRHMFVSAFEGNEGSVKVFLKNGFKMKATYKDLLEVKGKIRGFHLLEWKYSG